MLRTIRLRGELGRRFGRLHKLAVDTPAEALSALMANFPDMRSFFAASDARGVSYRCTADDDDLSEADLDRPLSRRFTVTPVVQGGGGLIKAIAGTVLAVVGVVTGQAWLISIGAAMALGGIAQLLSPIPKKEEAKKEENRYFDGAQNVTAQGVPVPFGYGRMIVGSRVISAGITIEDQYSNGYAFMGGFAGDRRYA